MDNQTKQLIDQLAVILQQLLSTQDQLLAALQQKRAALRTAQYDLIAQLCQQENAIIQQFAELEKRRLHLVADLTLAVEPNAVEPMQMQVLAERLPDVHRARLLVLRQQLRHRTENVRTQTNIARLATDSLVNHMQGLMHSIGAVCSGVSLYDRDGAPPKRTVALSTFNATA